MGQMNIAQQLLKGSAEIDRMRTEIDQIIAMMIGYLNKSDASFRLPVRTSPLDRSGLRFNHGVETWIVGCLRYDGNRQFIELEVSPWEGVRTVYYSEWPREKKLNTIEISHVKGVYDALPRLVEGLAKQFPEMAQKWQPLLKAAE